MPSPLVAIVAGTRPEVIKMAPIYFALKASTVLRPVMISTGQHRQMLDQAFGVFGISPDLDLGLMQPGQTLPDLTSRVITAMTGAIKELKPSAVLLQGDTTTVLGSALAAFYEQVPIGHVEAGLRTGNMRSPFPEEMNRRLTSPLARWNFCPTAFSQANLVREGIDPASCHITGNSVIDALFWVRDRIRARGVGATEIAARLGVPEAFANRYLRDDRERSVAGSASPVHGLENVPSQPTTKNQPPNTPRPRWVLVTGHRRESFGGGFERICEAINRLTREFPDLGVLYPVHLNPQVQEPVNRILGGNDRVALVAPAAYEDFIWLMDRCTFALSDSGGVQEEAPSLGKPVLVMRETTERPEGVEAGTCCLVGTDPDRILAEAAKLLTDPAEYARRSSLKNPYGDGQTGPRIREVLEASLSF